MNLTLTEQQKGEQASFRTFVETEIIPYANQCDEYMTVKIKN
ncbi:MAG: hypothetical protein AB3A66_15455 [Nodularia sp. CChRGM 3473]